MLRTVIALCLVGAAMCGPPVARTREEIQAFKDFLEGTRTERGNILLPRSDASRSSVLANSGKYQGDILLDEQQVQSMVEQFSAGRNAYIWPGTQWPSNTLVYEFEAGHFNDAQRDHIRHSMEVLESRTCIRFRPRWNNEHNYVRITNFQDGCYASVGYWFDRGEHTLNLADGCFNTIVIIHEWLHVIGFFHMQSTHNRDEYVRINWENMERGMEYNFDRYETDLVSNLGLPYEYDSCMHYGPFDFSINGRPTIDALWVPNEEMGHMRYVSGYDFYRVDRLYGCAPWRQASDYQPFSSEETPEFTDKLTNELPKSDEPEIMNEQ